MRSRVLHEEVLINLHIPDRDFNIGASSVQVLRGLRRRSNLPSMVRINQPSYFLVELDCMASMFSCMRSHMTFTLVKKNIKLGLCRSMCPDRPATDPFHIHSKIILSNSFVYADTSMHPDSSAQITLTVLCSKHTYIKNGSWVKLYVVGSDVVLSMWDILQLCFPHLLKLYTHISLILSCPFHM